MAAKLQQKNHNTDILSFFYLFISQKSRNFADVIELERHIEILLLNNDCVIVPGLGGFMAHHIDACYVDSDGLFLPPQRTLGFNPQLQINDSLLAQSYVEAYDISYPEAIRRIEDEVHELKMHLKSKGSYELNNIGILTLNENGNYVFAPCEAGILTPSLYGLNTFEFPKVARTQASDQYVLLGAVENETKEAVEEEVDETDDEQVVKIKFSWIRNTVAVAAVLLAIFLLALPTGKTEMMTRTISNINSNILFGMMSKDTNTSKIEIKKSDLNQIPIKTDTICKSDTVIPKDSIIQKYAVTTVTAKTELQADSVKQGYCIVLASYVSKQNANTFIDMLKKKGLDSVEIYMHKDVRRVIYGQYPTADAAYIALQTIHRTKGLEEAWVYKYQ